MVGSYPVASQSKVAIVTGATSGIGRETAWELCRKGYTVVLACRSAQAAQEVKKKIADAETGGHPVVIGPLDLQSMDSIQDFVTVFQRLHSRLDILVNNAGCNFISQWRTEKGVPGIVQVNFLGPFFLTRLLETQLGQCQARVVNVSSVMHRLSIIPGAQDFLTSFRAGTYGNSKLANAMFSQALYSRSRGTIQAASVDPGGVNTGIYRGAPFISQVVQLASRIGIMAKPAEGCQAVVYAATSPWPESPLNMDKPLQAPFFARGLFASPVVTVWGSNSIAARVMRGAVGPLVALLDQPVRWLMRGSCGTGKTFVVAANAQVLDQRMVDSLWEGSSQLCGLPLDLAIAM